MTKYFACFCLQRIVMPIALIACICYRPCLLSGLYLLILLYLPNVPIATTKTFPGHTAIFLRVCVVITFLTSLSQIAFQAVLLWFTPYGHFLHKCEPLERILRYVGLIHYDGITITEGIVWILPEVLALSSTVVIYVLCGTLSAPSTLESLEETTPIVDVVRDKQLKKRHKVLTTIGRYLTLITLCLTGSLRPSIPGMVYFLTFLTCCTWWACNKSLKRGFGILLRFLQAFAGLHIILLFLYQIQWFQEILPSDELYARLFDLKTIMTVSCENPRFFIWQSLEWTVYMNCFAVYILYYLCAVESKNLLQVKTSPRKGNTLQHHIERASLNGPLNRSLSLKGLTRKNTNNRWKSATRKVKVEDGSLTLHVTIPFDEAPLLGRSTNESFRSGRNSKSSRRSTVGELNSESIPLDQLGRLEEDEKPGILENILLSFFSIMYVLVRSSYLAANIMMMVWSITYHSWLTFVLLLWSNVLWLFPNQRKSMLQSSPFIVIYAELLLLSQYIYSMDLNENELPSTIQGFNLEQIGFSRPKDYRGIPLMIKSLYTIMFWITMRQYMQERRDERRRSTIADMVSPLQVSMGAATASAVTHDDIPPNAFMTKAGKFLKSFLTRTWIWVVAFMLFLSGITGNRMTGFRIAYMALFLVFVSTFQISWKIWRKCMYAFWLTVIIFSMAILVMVYTYQFDNFPQYWTEYLHIPETLQHDIGLELYATRDLFVRLLTPTFFVIITVIQLHYFHRDFLEFSTLRMMRDTTSVAYTEYGIRSEGASDIATRFSESISERVSDAREEIISPKTPTNFAPIKETESLEDEKPSTKELVKKFLNVFWEKSWLFLELHSLKLILILIMCLCCFDVCVVHFLIFFIIVVSLPLGSRIVALAKHISVGIIALMLLLRMIYQIDYIKHDTWDADCENLNQTTQNLAEWIGFEKVSGTRSLAHILRWYIVLITLSALQTGINIRQAFYRYNNGQISARPHLMFPEVNRANADNDSWNCIKFLFNYGFYKFGIEITMAVGAFLIMTRMDFFALLYGFWLLSLCGMNRTIKAKIWPFFITFIIGLMPIQYLMAVGTPPNLCLDFLWSTSNILLIVKDWLFLIDDQNPPPAQKIIWDFLLLMVATRQQIVFRIEERFNNSNIGFPGGNNKNITKDFEIVSFINPTPDYVSTIRNWLDIWKRGFFLGFLWFSLAIMFLSGTREVNIFSIGYLVGTFIFLWQGPDLFLRPIANIVNKWVVLMYYNVCVMITKCILQGFGCIYVHHTMANACWFVQLAGIRCFRQIGNYVIPENASAECVTLKRVENVLLWDFVLFICLIIQKRIFTSYYFFHIVDEAKAMTILASRGAELFGSLRERQKTIQKEKEAQILEKIRKKMDRIKANQRQIQGPNYREPSDHYVDRVPLARSPSLSSCTSHTTPAGYHTPISEGGTPPPAPSSMLQATTPCSAIMTVSLDAYLDPQRMSFESPPHSDLNQRAPSLDESFPVFSPPPYDTAIGDQMPQVPPRRTHHRQASIGPPWMGGLMTPRQSIISQSSRSPLSHHTYGLFLSHRPKYQVKAPVTYKEAVRSGDYYMFDHFDDQDEEEIEIRSECSEDEYDDLKEKMGIGEFITTILKTDAVVATEKALGTLRRSSEPGDKHFIRQTSRVSARSHLSAPPTIVPPSFSSQKEASQQEPVKEAKKDKIPEDSSTESDEISQEEDEPDHESSLTCREKIIQAFRFIHAFTQSCILTVTVFLNRFSRHYRFVSRVLTYEKKLLKEQKVFRVGIRRGSGRVWEPIPESFSILQKSREREKGTSGQIDPDLVNQGPQPSTSDQERFPAKLNRRYTFKRYIPYVNFLAKRDDGNRRKPSNVTTLPEIRILAPSQERGLDDPEDPSSLRTITPEETEEMSSADQFLIFRLILAGWFILISNTEYVCYFAVFLYQIKSASIISLPLPLMVFLWGSLAIPRPSTTFWITMITYTEVIVIIKCIFQFDIFPWNQSTLLNTNPFYPPKIFGIEKTPSYATYDLILLLVIFIHRAMLRSLGLWEVPQAPFIEKELNLHWGSNSSFIYVSIRTKIDLPKSKLERLAKNDQRRLITAVVTKPSTLRRQIKTKHLFDKIGLKSETISVRKNEPNMIVDEIPSTESHSKNSDHFVLLSPSFESQADEEQTQVKEPSTSKKDSVHFEIETDKIIAQPAELQRSVAELQQGKSYDSDDDVSSIVPEIWAEDNKDENKSEKKDEDVKKENAMTHLIVEATELEPYDYFPGIFALSMKKYFSPLKLFFRKLYDPSLRVATDVYAYMFICDFFNFMVIIFGFASFGTQVGDGGVSAYLKENKVPIPFLLMLILQFMLIIVDRALFLKKFILGKIIFQFFTIFGIHIWMFFILPAVTERAFNTRLAPQMWYMMKCFYLLLSAYQIRSGYPTRILGNFLCKSYNYVNMILFKGFMLVPFLFELRTVMDWMCTDTSMTVFDWLKMEDIFANIFQLKCTRHFEDEFPQKRGAKKVNAVKYLIGGAILMGIISIIWFPLVIFALGNTVGEPNIPYDVTMTLRIEPYQPIYSMTAQGHSIQPFTPRMYDFLVNTYAKDRIAQSFLSNYEYLDIATIKLNANSTMIWTISPPDESRLIEDLASDSEIWVQAVYRVTRKSNNKDNPGVVTLEKKQKLDTKADRKVRENLIKMLQGEADAPAVEIPYMLPKYIKITNIGMITPIKQLMEPIPNALDSEYRNITIKLFRSNSTDITSSAQWWEVREDCSGYNYNKYNKKISNSDCNFLQIYSFNEKMFPETLNIISGGGIIGLYTTLVFVASRVIRGIFSDIYSKIMFEDLPNVDRILQLCLDIYLVREARELMLEEDLFAKLVFLYRSPETLIKWTRPKEEEDEAGGQDDEQLSIQQ